MARSAIVVKAVSAFSLPSLLLLERIAKRTIVIAGEKMPRAFAVLCKSDIKISGRSHTTCIIIEHDPFQSLRHVDLVKPEILNFPFDGS